MAITNGLQRTLQAAARQEAAAFKERCIARIRAVMEAVEPALTPRELSVGLELDPPDKKRPVVSRWLSAAPRYVRTVPDEPHRALFERLLEGLAVMAVGPPIHTDDDQRLRQLTFCEPWEAERLGEHWQVVRFAAASSDVAEVDDEAIDWSGGSIIASEPIRVEPRRLAPGVSIPPLGLGAMRLSTASRTADGTPLRPTAAEAVAIIRRALDLGVRLIDTADSYALDDKDLHHNEHLIRQALDGWSHAERDRVVVATKAGLIRPEGRWIPNGRPQHLKRAAEGSLRALGVEALPLFQLHVKDRRVPYEESLGALADLYTEGKAQRLGVCNVNAEDLATALSVLPKGSLVSVQNKLNPFDTSAARGIVAMTRAHELAFLAHSPLGGHAGVHRVLKKDALAEVARRHGLRPGDSGRHEIALAWLLTLAPHIIPIFGATRTFSVESSLGALSLQLSDADRATLDAAFPKAAALRADTAPMLEAERAPEVSTDPLPPPGADPEVVMIMGIPGGGKSTLAEPYIQAGYTRLNRDEIGGRLDDLIPYLRSALSTGDKRAVLDNTYPTARRRAPVIAAAREAAVPVRCLWVDTTLADARHNAVLRMLRRHGRLLGPDEIAVASKREANTIPPFAQQVWLKNFEVPSPSEGFTQIERRPFARQAPPRTRRGLLLDVDGTLRVTRSGAKYPTDPADVELLPNRRAVLERYREEGYALFFISNQSGIASGRTNRQAVEACFDRTVELLGLAVTEVAYCPHQAFPIACFCRKPMPGMAVMLMERYELSLDDLIIVGDMKSDADLAAGLNARYVDAKEFFG